MAYTTINKPSDYFNTVLYTGNGSTQSITGVNFQPDLVWTKARSTSSNHLFFDVLRGATKFIESNTTDAEATDATSLTSFDSDGFSLGSYGQNNGSGDTVVSWNWLANGAGSSNTDGSITSTVSANQTSGFSIVKWVGTGSNSTIGHGLGVAPALIINKNLDTATNWYAYHKSLGATKNVRLNLTNASATETAVWNDTEPTSSVFSVGTNLSNNNSGDNHISYCFAEKKGFSKFGSYTGNGSTDGTFIYTGFKPAFIIRKRTDTIEEWFITDNKRIGYNPQNNYLFANSTQAESSLQRLDFLSNGFKIRTSDAGDNASGGTYIYMAFAEHPLVSSSGVPCTAR